MQAMHRGDKNGRSSKRAKRIYRAVIEPSPQSVLTRAYTNFKRSDDERADSIKFNEFAQHRPDLNLNYEPARWVSWYQRRTGILTGRPDQFDRDPEPLDDNDRGPLQEEDLILVPGPDNEHPELLDLPTSVTLEQVNELTAAPVKKQRKSRAKKSAAIESLEEMPVSPSI